MAAYQDDGDDDVDDLSDERAGHAEVHIYLSEESNRVADGSADVSGIRTRCGDTVYGEY